eukprot:s5341_g5.t1
MCTFWALFVPSLFYFLFCMRYLWEKVSPWMPVLTGILLISTVSLWLLTACTDPGADILGLVWMPGAADRGMDASWTTFMSMTGPSSASASSSSGQMAQESEKKPVKVSRMRTPLSSKATPFRSKTAGYCATMKAGFADSMIYPYSPELQDYVYLNMGNMTPSAVSGEESAGYGTGAGHQSVDSSCEEPVAVAPRRATLDKRTLRLPSRTPSPEQRFHWSDSLPENRPEPAVGSGKLTCDQEHGADGADPASPGYPERLLRGPLANGYNAYSLHFFAHFSEERRQLPLHVKRTFIHYDDHELELAQTDGGGPRRTRRLQRSESAPARLLSRQAGQIIQAHINGTCKPCGYFFAKADGCRWHNNCTFCHLCPPGELKRRKKQKRAMLKARNGAQAQNSPWATDEADERA